MNAKKSILAVLFSTLLLVGIFILAPTCKISVVHADTLTSITVSATDDAYENNSVPTDTHPTTQSNGDGFGFTHSGNILNVTSNTNLTCGVSVGLFFPNIQIPPLAQIVSANISIYCPSSSGKNQSDIMIVGVQAGVFWPGSGDYQYQQSTVWTPNGTTPNFSDDPHVISPDNWRMTTEDIGGGPGYLNYNTSTRGEVGWSQTLSYDTWTDSADISKVISLLVNDKNWYGNNTQNNNIVLLLCGLTDANNTVSFYSSRYSSGTYAAKLKVTYLAAPTLAARINTLLNAVSFTADNDLDSLLIGWMYGSLTATDVANWCSSYSQTGVRAAQNILYNYAEMSRFGIANQTKIEWALDNITIMANGLPCSNSTDYPNTFMTGDRYLLYGFYWSNLYSYETTKWNITTAYAGFKTAIMTNSSYGGISCPASYYVSATNGTWRYWDGGTRNGGTGPQPRWYDEGAQTWLCFLMFYGQGITDALNQALNTWNWINNNNWRTDHYGYINDTTAYECEGGFFFEAAILLAHYYPNLGNVTRIATDMATRYFSQSWDSPSWTGTGYGTDSYHMVEHSTGDNGYINRQLRIGNGISSWATIYSYYNNLTSGVQTNMTNMLLGYTGQIRNIAEGPTTPNLALTGTPVQYLPAWEYFFTTDWSGWHYGSGDAHMSIYDNWTTGLFYPSSFVSSDPTNAATCEILDSLLFMGMVPRNASLAIPNQDITYEDIGCLTDSQLYTLNMSSHVLKLSILEPGTVTFQYGSVPFNYTFSQQGIYTVTFASDWNSVTSGTRLSDLPSNYIFLSPPLAVAASPESAVIQIGETENFTASVAGGIAPYSYQWFNSSGAIVGSNSVLSITPTVNGTQTYYCNVTDYVFNVARSNDVTLMAGFPPLSVAFANTTATRIGLGSTFYVNGTVLYNGTNNVPGAGLATVYAAVGSTVKGQTTSYNVTTGNFNFSATAQNAVGNWTYTVYAVNSEGASVVNQTLIVISDELNITLSSDTVAPILGGTVHMNATATYSFDGANAATLGVNIGRNGTGYSNSTIWTDMENSTVSYLFSVQSANDTVYHLSVWTSNQLLVAWNQTVCEIIQILQSSTRTGINQNVSLSYRMIFAGNSSDVNSGTLTVNGTAYSISGGWCNFTVTYANVSSVFYEATSVSIANATLSQIVANPTIIYDQVLAFVSAGSTSPVMGATVTIYWSVLRSYDGTYVTSFNGSVLRDGSPWFGWLNATYSTTDISNSAPVTHVYSFGSIYDFTYGISALSSSSVSVTWESSGTGPSGPGPSQNQNSVSFSVHSTHVEVAAGTPTTFEIMITMNQGINSGTIVSLQVTGSYSSWFSLNETLPKDIVFVNGVGNATVRLNLLVPQGTGPGEYSSLVAVTVTSNNGLSGSTANGYVYVDIPGIVWLLSPLETWMLVIFIIVAVALGLYGFVIRPDRKYRH